MSSEVRRILNGEIVGRDAEAVLRQAIADNRRDFERAAETRQLIDQAEDFLVYGPSGRPKEFGYFTAEEVSEVNRERSTSADLPAVLQPVP